MECTIENNKLVPLSKVVSASILDTYGDIGKLEQRYSFWAARGLKLQYIQVLPKIKHKVLLTVNANTHTATLPLDFDEATMVAGIDQNWNKVPFKLNNRLVDSKNVIDIPCEDKCPKCNQDTNICNDLVVTENTYPILINDTYYIKTVIKKLYPNGDYYLETTTPTLDIENDTIDYVVKKEFIAAFDLKPCGCLDTTPNNIITLQNFCPDIYCNYYAPCNTSCNVSYGYKIFEESGLIQFDTNFPYDKCYLEYNGFIQKIGGQYYVPYVAFETLVEWTKWRAIKDKNNVPQSRILLQRDDYRTAKQDMQKVLGRISLFQITRAAALLPKLSVDYNWYSCFNGSSNSSVLNSTFGSSTVSTTSTGECCITNSTTIINRTGFILALKVDGNTGSPVDGESSYQNNVLIGATDLEYCFLAKQIFTKKDGDFLFNPITGVIDISPNIFVTNDSLIVPYNKNT